MSSRYRILVLCASFGGGHLSASRALHEYLSAHHGGSVEVRVIDFFEQFVPSLNVLARFAYQQSVQFFPAAYGTFFEVSNKLPSDPVVHELRLMGFARASAYIDSWGPDAVISTYPVAGGVVADLKATRDIVSATVVTDFGAHRTWLHPATDVYFVACDEVLGDLVARGVSSGRVVVSGIPISERFATRTDRRAARKALGIPDEFTVLLAPVGGGVGDAAALAGALADAGVQVLAIAGRSARLRRRLDSLARTRPGLHVWAFTNEMNMLMDAADVLVSKAGGLTVSESLACGLPVLIHNPVPGQELFNVDFLVNYGAGLLCRDEEDVVEKVRFLSVHPARLRQMADNARALGKPAASSIICERVLADIRAKR